MGAFVRATLSDKHSAQYYGRGSARRRLRVLDICATPKWMRGKADE